MFSRGKNLEVELGVALGVSGAGSVLGGDNTVNLPWGSKPALTYDNGFSF